MKTTYRQAAHQVLIALTLLMLLGCAPTKVLSDCEHYHPESGMFMPDFGFSTGGTCNDTSVSEGSSSEESEAEDDFLKDIEEPLEPSSSDLAVTVEEKHQTS